MFVYNSKQFQSDLQFLSQNKPHIFIGDNLPSLLFSSLIKQNTTPKDYWKVGRYHECLWYSLLTGLLSHQYKLSKVIQGLQIHGSESNQGKKYSHTLGEFDFLINYAKDDKKNDEKLWHHLEVAYKFYLLPKHLKGDKENHWFGPNPIDRLDIKHEKIKQQLDLYPNTLKNEKFSVQFLEQLSNVSIEKIHKFSAFLYVDFFEHYTNFNNTPKTKLSHISTQLVSHLWCYRDEFINTILPQQTKVWQYMPKPYWITYTNSESSHLLNTENDYKLIFTADKKSHLFYSSSLNKKLMVVPNNWPN